MAARAGKAPEHGSNQGVNVQPRGQLPELQVPRVGPTNANTTQQRQPTWALARRKCRLPPPHVGGSHLSACGASTFSFLGFGSSAAAIFALSP
ncbi:hypothetical protein NN561_019588 [Cricetulus griseus]